MHGYVQAEQRHVHGSPLNERDIAIAETAALFLLLKLGFLVGSLLRHALGLDASGDLLMARTAMPAPAPQQCAGTTKASFDSSCRNSQLLRSFSSQQPFDNAHLDDGPVSGRQICYSLPEYSTLLLPGAFFLWAGLRIDQKIGRPPAVLVGNIIRDRSRAQMAALPQMRARGIRHNTVYPSRQAAATLELVEVKKRGEQPVLQCVLRILRVLKHARRGAIQLWHVRENEFFQLRAALRGSGPK